MRKTRVELAATVFDLKLQKSNTQLICLRASPPLFFCEPPTITGPNYINCTVSAKRLMSQSQSRRGVYEWLSTNHSTGTTDLR
jgi:hypothetical protein